MENKLQEIICKLRYKILFLLFENVLLNEINYGRNVKMSCSFCPRCYRFI